MKTTSRQSWEERLRAARSSDIPAVLRHLADDPEISVRQAVAENPATPPGTLDQMARAPAESVRWYVAANPSTPPGTVELLASDSNSNVRIAVAGRPDCPPATLAQLAQTGGLVRRVVAGHRNTPPGVLGCLLQDKDPFVAQQAAANPSLPRAALAMYQLAGGHKDTSLLLLHGTLTGYQRGCRCEDCRQCGYKFISSCCL